MKEERKALKRLRQETCSATYMPDFDKDECCNVIEKAIDVLDIVAKKLVNITMLSECNNYNDYVNKMHDFYQTTAGNNAWSYDKWASKWVMSHEEFISVYTYFFCVEESELETL